MEQFSPTLIKRVVMIMKILFVGLFITHCAEKKGSPEVVLGYITFQGKAVSETGAPIAQAKLYLVGTNQAIGVTGTNGNFKIDLLEDQLQQYKTNHSNLVGAAFDNHFNLYLEHTSNAEVFQARSNTLSYDDRGVKDLGNIILAKPASIEGVVNLSKPGGHTHSISGVKVIIGRSVSSTNSDGRFHIGNLPSGDIPVFLFGDETDLSSTSITIKKGENHILDYPLLVYSKESVEGALIPKPQGGINSLVSSDYANIMSFKVVKSKGVARVRIYHEREKVENIASDLSWGEVNSEVTYEFPKSGPHTLYYRFADAALTKFSSVHVVNANVDPFLEVKGITIGDGSGVVRSRNVVININLPQAATGMRCSEKQEDLSDSGIPFVEASSEYNFVFTVEKDSQDDKNLTNHRTVYCQLQTADGTKSSIYKKEVRFSVFPEDLKDDEVFIIGDGSGTVYDKNKRIKVKINAPENAVEYRMFEEPTSTTTIVGGAVIKSGSREHLVNTFLAIQDEITFQFSDEGGSSKVVFFQFRDKDGVTSRLFHQVVKVGKVDKEGASFIINDDSGVSATQYLQLRLSKPNSGSNSIKIGEDPARLNSLPPRVFQPVIPYVASKSGLVTVYVQFLDSSHEHTLTIAKEVFIDPFKDGGSVRIDKDNNLTVHSRVVTLGIEIPLHAKMMRVASSIMKLQSMPFRELQDTLNWYLNKSESDDDRYHTVYLQFVDEFGALSPVYSDEVILNRLPDYLMKLEINNGDATTSEKDLVLDLIPPPDAVSMKISESLSGLVSAPLVQIHWEDTFIPTGGDRRHLKSSFTVSEALGEKSVYVKYILDDGTESIPFSNVIELIDAP